jgi:hypothetical protein
MRIIHLSKPREHYYPILAQEGKLPFLYRVVSVGTGTGELLGDAELWPRQLELGYHWLPARDSYKVQYLTSLLPISTVMARMEKVSSGTRRL